MSEIAICNHALSLLAVNPIISFGDDTPQSNLCGRLYPILRDHVLEERAWTFATGRDTLLPDATPPEFGFDNRFLLPSPVIRVIYATDILPIDTDENNVSPLNWKKEGGYILADTDKLYVKYVEQVTDTSLFSPSFKDCLAYRLAADMAMALTENRSLMADMQGMYADKLIKSGLTDGAQGRRDSKYIGRYVTRR